MSDSNQSPQDKQHQKHRKSDNFLQQIADLTPELLFVIDLDELEVIYVNKKVEQLLGHSASYIYKQGREIFQKVLHPDDYPRRLENLNNCRHLPDNKESEVEVRLKSADGNWTWVRIREKVFKRKADGAVWQTIGIAQDIHEQKMADEKLQEEHRRFKDAQAIGHIGSFERALPGELAICSEEFLRIHGLELQNNIITIHKFLACIHPEDIEAFLEAVQHTHETGEPLNLVNRIVRPDGSTRFVHRRSQIIKNAQGTPIRVYGTIQDVTEVKKSAQTIQQMLNGSIAAISILESVRDEQGNISDFIYREGNKAAEKVLNRSLNDMRGKTLLQLWPGTKEEIFDKYVQVIETAKPLRVEKHYQHDGFNHWFDISAVKNGDGFILTLQDITAQKKAEQEVIRVKDELAQQAIEKYLTLFNSIDEGFSVLEVIFDEKGKPFDGRFIDVNPAFEQQSGIKNAPDRTLLELVPEIEPFILDVLGKVAISGEPKRFENQDTLTGRWFDVNAFRVGNPEDRQVAVLFNDITERKRQEANLSFLAEIQDDFSRLSAAGEIMEAVGEKMYQHFDVSRLTMSEVDEKADTVTVLYEQQASHLKGTEIKTQPLSDFVNDRYKREFKTQPIIAIKDIKTDPRTADKVETYNELGAGSQLHAHYLRQDLWCFIITLHKDTPYQWRPDEIELLQEIATRLYLRLERAHAETAMRESEAKYRDLFNSIDQGFAVLEGIPDENNTSPVDFRILEVNSKFQSLTEISPEEAMSGKTLRQIRPELEEKWYQYGRSGLYGEPQYFEEHSEALGNRWYGVNMYRTEGAEKQRLAILFNDITERKNAEKQIRQQNAVLDGINRIFREALSSQTEEELGRVCLNVAEEITGSKISFMGEINPKTGRLDDIAISDRSWKEFGVNDTSNTKKLLPAGLMIHGIYGRVILDNKGFYTNNPPSHPDSIGTPKSHPKLSSFLGVPLTREGEAIGMIGLANREGGYGAEELEMAEALAPAIVQAFLRKRTEEELRQSEEQFRAVVDLVPDLLWSRRHQGPTDWCNQQWMDYTGQSFEEAMDYSWLNAIHPEDKDKSLTAFQAAVAAGEALRVEHRIRRHDGAYRWFLVQKRPIKDATGKIVRWYGTATDVHEERIAMETLRRSEGWFRFMANAIPQIVWITDADGKVEFSNQVFLNYTGARETPSTAQEMADLYVHPEDVPVTMDNWDKAQAHRKTFIVEHRIRSAQGEYRWFLVRAEPFFDTDSGKIKRWFGTSTDVHDNKLTEEALIKAKEEAEKAAKAKEEFLSTMSHEIRTPLNAVVSFTHLLLQQKPREDQKESLNGLKYSSRNLMSLINDILDFSKIEAGKVVLKENEFDLLDLMFSLKQAHQSLALQNNTELKLSLEEEIPETIISDQLKLSQVLHNLLGNAVKFTRLGLVSLEVKMSKQEGEYIWLDFSIADTGIGIAEEKIPHIFEKFSQADSSTIRHYGGTGLGLAITKMLLEVMGSQIEVESQEGKGSRFYFSLPVKAGSGNSNSIDGEYAKAVEEEKDHQQANILLVEDVDLNRLVIRKFLKEWWDLVPDEAVNGIEAVEKAKNKDYDFILMDVRMPEMDGYEATRIIRGLAGKETIPVIALTADTGRDIKQKPEAAFFTEVITKPFDPKDLKTSLLRFMPVKQEHRNPDAYQGGNGHHLNLKEVEKDIEEDPEETEIFYQLTYKNLQEYKTIYNEALTERDIKKLGDMKHKATILLDTFGFHDLTAYLKNAQSMLKENADSAKLQKAQNEGDALFDQKLAEIKAKLEKRK